MDQAMMRRTAILIDGGYYRKRSLDIWGRKGAAERAAELYTYCMLHISRPEEPRDLYRIFYYDCPPLTRQMIHPLTGEKLNFSDMSGTKWTNTFFEELARKRKLAIRRGELAESQACYILKDDALRDILAGRRGVDTLTRNDFRLDVKQKGVDMRIGLDVASLAYGGYVDQIVLIAGDSDFIPVAKMARKHGLDFILDPMKQHIKPKLSEHIDGIETYTDELYAAEDIAAPAPRDGNV